LSATGVLRLALAVLAFGLFLNGTAPASASARAFESPERSNPARLSIHQSDALAVRRASVRISSITNVRGRNPVLSRSGDSAGILPASAFIPSIDRGAPAAPVELGSRSFTPRSYDARGPPRAA